MDAHEILYMLLRNTKHNGFEIKYESPVTEIVKSEYCWNVKSCDKSYMAKNVIIASGGCSYPTTGSDGSLFKVLSENLDIKITQLKPALSSIQVSNYPYGELSGISFETAGISIWHSGSKVIQNEDALLFTHKDLSGPGILNISKYASAKDRLKLNYLHP